MGDANTPARLRLAAHHAGLSTFRVGHNKRPAVHEWRSFMRDLPEEADVVAEAGRTNAYAIVCGAVSDRLVMLDFEAGFVPRLGELAARLRSAGLYDNFATWLAGYSVVTPGGGLHVGVHLSGDDAVASNTKLAFAGGGVIAETRGEGGYVVGPASNGDTHPSGRPWVLRAGGPETIAWDTPEVFAAVCAVIASFDESVPLTPAVVHAVPSTLPSLRSRATGMPDMATILARHGFAHHHDDNLGHLWTRPDKSTRDGHSVRINANGRLMVFTTAIAGLVASDRRTYDEAEVDLALRYGRQPTPRECAEWFFDYVARPRPAADRDGGTAIGVATSDGAAASLRLDDEFWRARPYLAHVRDAARASELSPDALWEAVKVFYAATVPWNFRLPRNGTLDYIAAMVGRSGSGKTMAKQAALDLLPPAAHMIGNVRLGLPPGSGEGMTESFLKRTKTETTIHYRGAGFYVDEGKWLFDVDRRSGNTTIQALKQAWSGELTGNLNATAERSRWLPARAVRACFLIGAQPGVAASFLRADLADGGLPQRVSFGWCHLEDADFVSTVHPGVLDIPIWSNEHWGYNPSMGELRELTYNADLASDLAVRQRSRSKGEGIYDGHSDYAMCKTAALIALMDGRREVQSADWDLALADWNASVAVRSHILENSRHEAANSNVAIGEAKAHQALAAESVFLERAVVSLVAKLNRDTHITARQARDHLKRFQKAHHVPYTEVLDVAVQRGLIVIDTAADGSVLISKGRV